MTDFAPALRQLWPKGNSRIPGLLDGMIETAPEVFAKYGIVDQVTLAQFMAQISHECGAGTEVVENLNYTAQRIRQVWPSRFGSVAEAVPYEHNPRGLANKVYNGRMGNREGTDDGWNYRGRGASQTTGREGYAKLGQAMGKDFLSSPDSVNDPKLFLACGAQDFVLCGCLPFAKQNDLKMVTKKLNGGYIGLEERQDWFNKWWALGVSVPPLRMVPRPVVPTPTQPPVVDKPKQTAWGWIKSWFTRG